MSSFSSTIDLEPEPQSASAASHVTPLYDGKGATLFKIAFIRMAITILTFGIGRFWMTTRLRRHYWSSIRIAGDPLEYTGKALELLLGFLMALVIIAVYLIVINLGLTFVGLSVLQGNLLALQLPLLALAPFFFWAQYRARRYLLARTRWRGVRFALMPGAWGYMARAIVWGLLTIVTLGFLYPLMQMRLASYTTERMRYGHLAFRQEGRWTQLLKSWLWVWLPIPILIALFGFLLKDAQETPLASAAFIESDLAPILMLVLYAGIGFAWIRHSVLSFNYLNSNKVLGGETHFTCELKTTSVLMIIIGSSIAMSMLIGLSILIMSMLSYILLIAAGQSLATVDQMMLGDFQGFTASAAIIAAGLIYLTIIPIYVALTHVLITHPLLKAAAESARIHNLEAAERARQRAHDEQAEAGGFADALDVDMGAAF